MGLRAVLASLPRGYEAVRGRRGILAVERSCRAALERGGFSVDGDERLVPSDLVGRGPLEEIRGEERYVVRRFHHGGALRILGEQLFLRPSRPFRELVLAARLRETGIATPEVVAARARRSWIVGWKLALVTRRVDDAPDGARWLEAFTRGERSASERARFFARTGELVGRLHAAGFLHTDLTARNLIARSDLSTVWVLDLDGGRFGGALGVDARRDNLRRLYRWVRRRAGRGRFALTRGDYLRFLVAYRAALPAAEAPWRADWTAIVERDRARSALHRFGWWLEDLLGGGPETRDGSSAPAAGIPPRS